MIKRLNRNLICKECGVKSQRWGKCWEKGLCAVCAKQGCLICDECGSKSNNVTAMCWRFGKCGKCYYKKDATRLKIVCPECRVLVYKLRYNKFGVHSIDLFYCINCSGIINHLGSKIHTMKCLERFVH